MFIINILRVINFNIFILYTYFLITREIKFNLLTIVPIVVIFAYEMLGRHCVNVLKEYKKNYED